MKLITAIIRPQKLNDVLEALFNADVRGLTITRAQGHGGDGKIFVVPIEKVLRIRTGEEDSAAVTPALAAAV